MSAGVRFLADPGDLVAGVFRHALPAQVVVALGAAGIATVGELVRWYSAGGAPPVAGLTPDGLQRVLHAVRVYLAARPPVDVWARVGEAEGGCPMGEGGTG